MLRGRMYLAPVAAQAAPEALVSVRLTEADHKAVQGAVTGYLHAVAVKGPNGFGLQATLISAPVRSIAAGAGSNPSFVQSGVRWPGDVSYLGGAVITSAQQHIIYLLPNGSCPVQTCWGDPQGFLTDLSNSDFIHLADQYVGASTGNRYPLGKSASISFAPPRNFSKRSTPFTDADMQAAVHNVAAATGQTGYGHLYHILLPRAPTYAPTLRTRSVIHPDSGAQWFFCGYHTSVDFADIGHVVYAVEPYQDVSTPTVFTLKASTCAVQPKPRTARRPIPPTTCCPVRPSE